MDSGRTRGSLKGEACAGLGAHESPARKIVGLRRFITDLTLPFGRVLHDYLK